jgi:hypothetical protein
LPLQVRGAAAGRTTETLYRTSHPPFLNFQVTELVLEAERRVGLRPDAREVGVEKGAWRAVAGQAVRAIARQVHAGLVWEVVDDLITEVSHAFFLL